MARKALLLYAVTDRAWVGTTESAQRDPDPAMAGLLRQVEQALRGGVTMVQLREKDLSEEEFLREAREMRALCNRYGVPLIINDNVAIARAVKAAGVHLGQDDTELAEARTALGPNAIIGASARTVEQALRAERQGADYLGAGAVFETDTKEDAKRITRGTLAEICAAVSIPVVAIGGITEQNISELAGTGIAGIAVVRALFARDDIEAVARRLHEAVQQAICRGPKMKTDG